MSMIIPELYDTKSYYQLIESMTKCEKLSKSRAVKRHSKSKENISEQVIGPVHFVHVCFQSALVRNFL